MDAVGAVLVFVAALWIAFSETTEFTFVDCLAAVMLVIGISMLWT